MKLIILVGLLFLLTIQWVSTKEANSTAVAPKISPNKLRFLEIIGSRLKSLWFKFTDAQKTPDSFIGRCFGVARKLKFALPLVIFKLGVIVTILVFLTIFSLKTLGLLGFLVLFSVSGALSKLAVAFSGKHAELKALSPPQNVHFHVHQSKEGNFDLEHASSGWEDRLDKYGTSNEDFGNEEASHLYNKIYLNNLLLRNQGYINR